jgi:hypothetical protein
LPRPPGRFSSAARSSACSTTHSGTSTALASLQSSALWPALVPGKASLAGADAAPAGEPIADQFVHQASASTGVGNGLSYHTPTVIEGAYRMAALAPGTQLTDAPPTNMTVIAKTPPPDPVDETITLDQGQSLTDRLVALGATKAAARALAEAVEPVFPTSLIKPGQTFTVTLDKQLDFYGNDVIYPVRLSFSPGPKEEIVVEADIDGSSWPACRAERRTAGRAISPRRITSPRARSSRASMAPRPRKASPPTSSPR